MPSPFPGMDPFIESRRWKSFHSLFIAEIAGALVPQVRPRYVVDVEERVYLEHEPDEGPRTIEPGKAGAPAAVAHRPMFLTVPMPVQEREHFLTIRDRQSQEVIAVIEVLSPTNKRPSSDGQREYLRKREAVLRSGAHLVEFDLLRGGGRLPTIEPLPPGDYYAFVGRVKSRPKTEVYYWDLRALLPEIPVPLAGSDPDVKLCLQAVFTATYDRAGFDYALAHTRPVEPALSAADAEWVRQALAAT